MPRLTPIEAAAYVNIGKKKLERLRTQGGGPLFTKIGRDIRYDTADLDHWMDALKRSSTADIPETRYVRRPRRFGG